MGEETVGLNGHAKLDARLVRKHSGLRMHHFLLAPCLLSATPRSAETNHPIVGKPHLFGVYGPIMTFILWDIMDVRMSSAFGY